MVDNPAAKVTILASPTSLYTAKLPKKMDTDRWWTDVLWNIYFILAMSERRPISDFVFHMKTTSELRLPLVWCCVFSF